MTSLQCDLNYCFLNVIQICYENFGFALNCLSSNQMCCSLRQGSIYTGEEDGTPCAAVNQLWAWLFTNSKKNRMHQRPILELVDVCTSGLVTFPLY